MTRIGGQRQSIEKRERERVSDDIEKEPAYKRQGVNLEDAKHSSETDLSRTSIGLDDNDDIQLRSNNSFLHDNVD